MTDLDWAVDEPGEPEVWTYSKAKEAFGEFLHTQAEDFKIQNQKEVNFNAEDIAIKFVATFSSILISL